MYTKNPGKYKIGQLAFCRRKGVNYVKSICLANILCNGVGKQFCIWEDVSSRLSPALLTMLRLLFIVLFLIGLSLYKKHFKRVNKSDLLAVIFLGVIGVFINQWSFFVGLQTADSTTSALILATTLFLNRVTRYYSINEAPSCMEPHYNLN